MDYKELKQIFQDLKRSSPREDLTAHIVFTEDSFDQPYPLLSRTYRFSSDNKAFWSRMGGRSIFGSTCIRVYKTDEKGKTRLEPLTGTRTAGDGYVDLPIDRVYGYCALLERCLNEEAS